MNIQVLIVGQGLAGTVLSQALHKAGISFLIIDESKPNTASKAASGVINPVTGKRLVKSWLIDELVPRAIQTYGHYLREASIIDFFPTPDARITFLERQSQDGTYLSLPVDEAIWAGTFNYPFGFGQISPAYLLDINGLISDTRTSLLNAGLLREARFSPSALEVHSDGVVYEDILASKIIFCDGIGAADLPWFERLPFAPNKGEALIVEIPEGLGAAPDSAHTPRIFKERLNLVPYGEHQYWVGSTYQWSFTDDQPSEAFRKQTETILGQWLRLPFRVIDHFAAIRPATLERQLFVGFHPVYSSIGIFGGLGMKGCSLAPYFADQLVAHITSGSPILPQADIKRFTRILSV